MGVFFDGQDVGKGICEGMSLNEVLEKLGLWEDICLVVDKKRDRLVVGWERLSRNDEWEIRCVFSVG